MRTLAICVAVVLAVMPLRGLAAPFAALVMDARTGEVLYASNAETRLHPASLTKMLTLYIAFEAIRKGEISLDTRVKVSKNAANEDPSKLGLKAGQTIAMRYLIRAAAVKSANDCATAIGEAISGSEEAFSRRMNRTAKALGMTQSTFKNANGLTRDGHLSTAHDMTLLGRRLFYDFPEFYNIFSRRTTDAGIATVNNTNSRFLDAYKGADGIKTGYTGPAGFNLVASAERGDVRIIATVFGGTSTAQRNAKMAELLDLGFAKAPVTARVSKPAAPVYADPEAVPEAVLALVASIEPEAGEVDTLNGTGKTLRISGGISVSPLPRARPGTGTGTGTGSKIPDQNLAPGQDLPDPNLIMAMEQDIQSALAAAQGAPTADTAATPEAGLPDAATVALAGDDPARLSADQNNPAQEMTAAPLPETPPFEVVASIPEGAEPAIQPNGPLADPSADPSALAREISPTPRHRPQMVLLAAASPADTAAEPAPEVVSRMSSSSGRVWGITLGQYPSKDAAERVLMKTALAESGTLAEALRKVVKRKTGFEAHFAGMSQDQADLACRRLQARAIQCFTLGP